MGIYLFFQQFNNYNQNRGQGGNRGYNNNNNSNNNNNNNRGGNYQRRNYNNNNNNNNTSGHEKQQDRTPRPGEDRPKREAILDLAKYLDKRVKINCLSRREVIGVLKGYDQLMNLVLDDTTDIMYSMCIDSFFFKKSTLTLLTFIQRRCCFSQKTI